MGKCLDFNNVLLVYLLSSVDSQMYTCQNYTIIPNGTSPYLDFRMVFTANIPSVVSWNRYLCNVTGNMGFWSQWSECISTGDSYRHRSLVCQSNQSQCLISSKYSSAQIGQCSPDPDNTGFWSQWSECVSSGDSYRHRSLVCHSNQSQCLISAKNSSAEISQCTPDPASFSATKDICKEREKCYTLTEIILVAFGCLLLGAVLSTLLFFIYMRRTQQGCFTKSTNNAQSISNQQSGPNLKIRTESVVKKYEGNNPKSSHSNKENIAEETHYQYLESNQVDNDQQTYVKLKAKESRFGPQGFHADPSSPKHSGDFVQTDHIANLQNKTERGYENSLDSDGHNYLILERKALQEKIIPGMWNVQKPHVVVREETNRTILEKEDNQYVAVNEYFVLEHLENGQNQN